MVSKGLYKPHFHPFRVLVTSFHTPAAPPSLPLYFRQQKPANTPPPPRVDPHRHHYVNHHHLPSISVYCTRSKTSPKTFFARASVANHHSPSLLLFFLFIRRSRYESSSFGGCCTTIWFRTHGSWGFTKYNEVKINKNNSKLVFGIVLVLVFVWSWVVRVNAVSFRLTT